MQNKTKKNGLYVRSYVDFDLDFAYSAELQLSMNKFEIPAAFQAHLTQLIEQYSFVFLCTSAPWIK